MVCNKEKELEQWISVAQETTVNVDEVVSPSDLGSSQFVINKEHKELPVIRLLELVSEDAVIEDLLYYLQQGLVENKMDSESYLKVKRKVCCG
jgi:hypothetical protein